MSTCLLLSVLLFITSNAKHTYKFQLYVSSNWAIASASDDTVWFRLCTTGYSCTKWGSRTGWSLSTSYNFNLVTPQYLGPIGIAQILHKGSDQVCFGHIKVDDVEYDDGATPDCLDHGGSGCEIVTVTLSSNNWNHRQSTPCEYNNILDDTWEPTPAPTNQPTPAPTSQPTDPSKSPTVSPTSPTNAPTFPPTAAPTFSPTDDPSNAPSVSPTYSTDTPTSDPTMEPTFEPTFDPTGDPTLEPTPAPTDVPSSSPSKKTNQEPN